jgi:hypothetical protein
MFARVSLTSIVTGYIAIGNIGMSTWLQQPGRLIKLAFLKHLKIKCGHNVKIVIQPVE